jgi:hypothetical protein
MGDTVVCLGAILVMGLPLLGAVCNAIARLRGEPGTFGAPDPEPRREISDTEKAALLLYIQHRGPFGPEGG